MTDDGNLNIFDLLREAEEAENTVIKLPEAVRVQLSGYNKTRLRLLTFENIVALADWAVKYPDRWKVLKLHHLKPSLSTRDIALLVDRKVSIVNQYLQMDNIDPVEYWDLGDDNE